MKDTIIEFEEVQKMNWKTAIVLICIMISALLLFAGKRLDKPKPVENNEIKIQQLEKRIRTLEQLEIERQKRAKLFLPPYESWGDIHIPEEATK